MKFVPNALSRTGSRYLLKLNGASPTLLVVAGVGGLVVTAVLAAKATRKLDPILDTHEDSRAEIERVIYSNGRAKQKDLVRLYGRTSLEFAHLYGPALVVGTVSVASVLGGHKILRGRHVATLAAYSGLMDQFQSYRKRISDTLGDDVERGIYEGAKGRWVENEGNKGEYTLTPVFDNNDSSDHYLRPWFDECNKNWTRDALANFLFLKGVQSHMNTRLAIKGHVFLNEVFDALGMPRTREGVVAGWLYEGGKDGFIDFGFMSSIDPQSVAFCNNVEKTVRLNFNIDGVIWDQI